MTTYTDAVHQYQLDHPDESPIAAQKHGEAVAGPFPFVPDPTLDVPDRPRLALLLASLTSSQKSTLIDLLTTLAEAGEDDTSSHTGRAARGARIKSEQATLASAIETIVQGPVDSARATFITAKYG